MYESDGEPWTRFRPSHGVNIHQSLVAFHGSGLILWSKKPNMPPAPAPFATPSEALQTTPFVSHLNVTRRSLLGSSSLPSFDQILHTQTTAGLYSGKSLCLFLPYYYEA